MTIRVFPSDEKFYKWEQTTSWYKRNSQHISLEECQALVNKVRKDYKYRPRIFVKDGRGSVYGRALHGPGLKNPEIHLPLWARNKCLVLHELAHILNPKLEPFQHGPSYLRTYMVLAEKYLKIDPVKAILHSRFFGVRIK